MHESHSENNKSKFLPKNVDKTLARLVLYYIRLCSMVFREGSTKIPIRPVVLNKFRELWEYEKKHKKDRTHKFLEVSLNDLLQSTLERYERLSEYAIFLSVYGYNDDKITLHDVNSNRKTNSLDLNVEDSKLMCAKDNKIGCIYCHFVLVILKVA